MGSPIGATLRTITLVLGVSPMSSSLRRSAPSPPPKEFGREDAEALAAVALRYGFVKPRSFLYQMTKDFSAVEYLALLRTYPDHMALPEQKREGLFTGIANAIQQHGGTLTVFYTVDMELAQKPEQY